jgi:hypothetical protein
MIATRVQIACASSIECVVMRTLLPESRIASILSHNYCMKGNYEKSYKGDSEQKKNASVT